MSNSNMCSEQDIYLGPVVHGGVRNMGSTGRAQSAEDHVMDRILPDLGQNCKK